MGSDVIFGTVGGRGEHAQDRVLVEKQTGNWKKRKGKKENGGG